MKKRGHKIYAPGSISAFILGLLSLLCAFYPVAAMNLGVMVLFNLNFFAPAIGVIIGIGAVVHFIRAKKYAKRQSLASGKGFARTGLIFGIIGILVGLTFSVSYVIIAREKKGPPNHPVGDARLFFYGNEEQSEIALRSILLPDETILTIGHTSTSLDKSGKKLWDTILLKTDIEGRQIWFKTLKNRSGGRAVVNSDDDILLSVISTHVKNRAAKYPALGIIKLNLDGDSLDARVYDFGDTITAPRMVSLSDGNSLFYAKIGTNLLMMKTDKNGDSLWSKFHPVKKKSIERICIETSDGGFVLAGYDPILEDSRELFKIMKTDSLGNMIWNNSARDSLYFSPMQIIEAADGALLMAGNRSPVDSDYARVMKLDRDGKLIWNKPIGNGQYTYITGMIPWTEGNYLAVGRIPFSNWFKFTNFGRIRSWDTYYLATVSPEGELIHSFHGAQDIIEPWGITLLDDGYCVLTGFGGKWEKSDNVEISNQDIGLLYYRAGQ